MRQALASLRKPNISDPAPKVFIMNTTFLGDHPEVSY